MTDRRVRTRRATRLVTIAATAAIVALVAAGLSVPPVRVAQAADQGERSLPSKRPNVVLLVTDDQRYDTLGCMGNSIVQTPHLDELARRGVLFRNCFVTTSICATSRASLITGQYARRHGIWDFGTMLSPEAFAQTFPAVLRKNGYRVGFVGKWGVGNDLPADEYDYWAGYPGQGKYYEHGEPERDEHLTAKIGRQALEFLEGCDAQKPFCLQVSFKAPHCQDGQAWQFPYDLRHKELYRDAEIAPPATATDEHFQRLPEMLRTSEGRVRWKLRFDGEEMRERTVKDYYRLITGVDEVVGQIVAALAKKGVDGNTIIVFTSDNGFYLGDHGLAGKWFAHDVSIRVPLVIYDPRLPEDRRGCVEERLVLNFDLAPTILEAAGLAVPDVMQGRGLAPLVEGKQVAWRDDFLYEHLFEHPRIPKTEGVRTSRWKYARYTSGGETVEQLFDWGRDPLEEKNLADSPEHAEVLGQLRTRLRELIAMAGPAAETETSAKEQPLVYPETMRGDQVDDYHGTTIADPYRWLEDLDSDETGAWVAAQNKVTRAYIDAIPQRAHIRQRLETLWDHERFGLPHERGGRYFFTHNDGLQNQSVLYTADGLDAEPHVLLDPNTLSADGTVDLSGWAPNDDGRLLAFALSSAGSDWKELHVLDTATGKRLDDHVRWVKFSGMSWTPDGKGFYYSRYDEPEEGTKFTGTNYYQKLYYHRLGQPQENDSLIYQRPDQKQWGFDGDVTEDGRFLIVSVWRGTERKNQVFYQDLQKPDAPVVELITGFDAEYHFLDNDGPVLWFLTDLEAPNRRVIAVDTSRPERENWRELIAERPEALRGASVVGDVFIASYLQDACSVVRLHDLQGRYLRDLDLPGRGSAGGFTGRRGDRESFYSYTDFVTPTTIFRYDLATGESTVYQKPKVDFASDAYETRQVFFESRDGTRIPLFITHKKGLAPSGECPTLLYAYGGFNASITPSYSVFNAVWLEMGGVYAVANLRGGGEYGRLWHEAGMVDHKQNVFDDFLAAAQWLIDNGYTSPRRLAIRGGSNGGLLVGAAMTQRPDLFALALPAVGVMDMLRYHKFTIGWAWVSEYGSSDDPQQFKTLLAYSPLHNLKPGTRYPATLVTTGDHDDRVVPSHSFKYAATLQRAQATDGPPVLIRIETSAGHGAGKPTSKLIDEAADVLSFTAVQLGIEPK